MTDQELRDYAADHLYYELWMFYETGWRLLHDPAVRDDPWLMGNALVESFLIHARTLVMFLYSDKKAKRASDVTSERYVRDLQAWERDRGSIPSELKEVIRRTAKEIAHLTIERQPRDPATRGWRPQPIIDMLYAPLKLFVEHGVPDRMGGIDFFIAHLPMPSGSLAARPPVEGPLLENQAVTDARTLNPPFTGVR